MYRHQFYRMARTVQVALGKGSDIEHLAELDKKYWLVLSCPAKMPGDDGTIAKALDTDGDGRVRVPEVLAAVEWLKPRLNGFDRLFEPSTGLAAEDVNPGTDEGKALAQLLSTISPSAPLASAEIDSAIATFQAAPANGDGVVPASALPEALAPVADAILAVTGGADACDGSKGISADSLTAFKAARDAYQAWVASEPAVTFTSVGNEAAVAAVQRLSAKVDAFFLACNLVRYNPAAQEALVAPVTADALADAPLALPSATLRALPVGDGINPAYLADVATVAKLLDVEDAITPEQWAKAKEMVAPYAAWAAAKPAGADVFAGLAPEVTAKIADEATYTAIGEVITADEAQKPLAAAFADLRKLVALRTGFLRFLRNFVNTSELYPPVADPLFLVGTLFMDGRSCSLCFPIEKAAAAHAATAKDSKCCLAYCTIKRPSEGLTGTILAVVTAGLAEGLVVGRNGLFVDKAGKDWEATVCHVELQPISLLEAFFSPWRKVGNAFTGVFQKFIASKNDAVTAAMTSKATETATSVTAGAKPAAPAATALPGASMASIATLGIALSFVASAVAAIAAAVTNTPLWKTGLVIVGIILVVSVPSMLLTWFKLRARDLAPILNASDWAINRRLGLTTSLGSFFTQRACYIGRCFVRPPMRERHPVRNTLIGVAVLVVIAAIAGWIWCANCKAEAETPAQEPVTTEAPAEAPAAPEAPVSVSVEVAPAEVAQ